MTWKEEALEHAKSESPFESCGLLIVFEGKEKYCPCKNLAEEKTDQFIIDPEDWIRCEDQGEILAVVHSHPFDSCMPSQADLASCEYLNYPFYIISLYDNLWHKFEPSGYKAPLLGRTWVWGSQDCASLVYTWYREKRNIILKDWNGVWEGKKEVLIMNNNLFQDIKSLKVNIKQIHQILNRTYCHIDIEIDNTKLDVIDVIDWTENFKISKIEAFKG